MVKEGLKVVFLDRDGVINEYPGDMRYVTSWQEFKFISGSIEAVRNFKAHNFRVFVVSNQAGVSKGVYSKEALDEITLRMLETFRRQGADIDGVYYCTHREEENCDCRKPKIGLLKLALSRFEVMPRSCFFIGDSMRDIKAAHNFGCKSILVLSGQERIENRRNWEISPDYIFDDLFSSSLFLCSYYRQN
ncbi:MAG: HAD family hydrolase [Candidatus Omnitrophica bacterium]|nr:HAD family hydrolase [Candidatus Omnitrophota bacterium]